MIGFIISFFGSSSVEAASFRLVRDFLWKLFLLPTCDVLVGELTPKASPSCMKQALTDAKEPIQQFE